MGIDGGGLHSVRKKRLRRVVSSGLAGVTALAVVGLGSGPANGDPGDPPNSAEAMKRYQDLSHQAEKVNEDLLKSQDDLKAKQGELAQANGAIAQARASEGQAQAAKEQLYGEIDRFTAASFKGAHLDPLAAMMSSKSTQDFLDRATSLDLLANQRKVVLDKYNAAAAQAAQARQQAEDNQRRVQEATDAAAKLNTSIAQTKRDLDGQIGQVKKALDRLSAADRNALKSPGDLGSFVGVGKADTALQTALSQRGKPYVWGASGPSAYDCSGLMIYAYDKAGIDLPRSARAQYGVGSPVAKGAWQPGDLLFFGDSASSIHHVAMYVGGGKIVHAPTQGETVKVVSVEDGGSDYFAAKRVITG